MFVMHFSAALAQHMQIRSMFSSTNRSIVCPGVTVASHAILSVGSLANKDLEPYTIYKGNPAVKCKERIVD